MPLVNLPNELLDEVFSYLDWDPTESLCPSRVDLLNASLTCKQLRKILEPAIFRNVTLRLCWAQGRLIEPRWYHLRKQRPELAKHVRCVYIHTGSEQCYHCIQRDSLEPFVVPELVDDWLTMSHDPLDVSSDVAALRPRVNEYARKTGIMEALPVSTETGENCSAEDLVRKAKIYYRSNAELDALSIVMLCIPASVNKIVFKAHMEGVHNKDKNVYSHRLLSIALDLFHDKLQEITIISNQSVRRLGMSRRQIASAASEMVGQDWIPNEVLQKLVPKRLALAVNDEFAFRCNTTSFVHQGYQRWHQLSPTVRELDICYTKSEWQELVQFIKGFETLATIRFRDCILNSSFRTVQPQSREFEQHVWLNFAIEVRRAFPRAKIEMSNLWRPVIMDKLPNNAVNWLLTQAIPEGALIDMEREDRLLEDFMSFLPMWLVEDGVRGEQALKNWEKQRGPLSDQAMSRRWR